MFRDLCDYIKDELKELDRKVSSGGKLSMQELEYADKLAHMKKSLLTVDAMENPEEYAYHDGGYSSQSYMAGRGRNARRDSMGRYMDSSRMYRDDHRSMISELRDLMEKAPNEHTRHRFEELIMDIEKG